MASKRKSPKVRSSDPLAAVPSMPKRSKHQKMLDHMHDALYALSGKISPPSMPPDGVTNLLPKHLQPGVDADNKAMAEDHIEGLHKSFVEANMSKGKNIKENKNA